jgi:hypothetical protein
MSAGILTFLVGFLATSAQSPNLPPLDLPEGDVPHIGSYTPSSQLLRWCAGTKPAEQMLCDGYISGVLNAAGMADASFPKGAIDAPYAPDEIRKVVVDYLQALPNVDMTTPASRSVYEALVAKYPYSGFLKPYLPIRPTQDEEAGG